MKKLETALCLLRKDDEILLAMKKRGFGEDKYNGVGGKLETNETPEETMIREVKEEIGIKVIKYDKVGLVEFDEYYKEERQNLVFHLYFAYDWLGDIIEIEEMRPEWFKLESIPYDNMFPDDKYWLPLVIDGKKIKAYFKFDKEWNLIEKDIEEITNESINN